MKKISIISLLLMAVVSCQVAELTAPVEESAPVAEQVLFYVGMEEEVDTKTSSTVEGDILWSAGDKMNIFYGLNNNNKDFIELRGGEGTKNGKFYGPYIVVGENQLKDLHQTVIVYPFDENTTCVANESKTEYTVSLTIPSVQNYAKDSFGNGAYPMVGVTETPKELVVETKNVASVINFRIKGTASISKIVLSSDEAALAGPTTVVTSYGNVPVATVDDATGSKSIELVCDGVQLNSETATNFNIVLAPYTGVVKVTIYDTNGGYTVRTLPERVYKRGGRVNFNHTFAAEHSIIDDLKKAFKNGGEYTLPVDVTVTEQLLISGANKKLNLDLNGNTLTCNANLTGTNGTIQTTGAELNITNGTIVNKAGYFFVTNGYNDNLHLELTDVDLKGSTTAVFYFADGTDIVLNNVNVKVSGKGFYSFKKMHNGTIFINGGTYKTSGKVFDFTSNLPVTFLGDCLFSDKSYAGVDWVESGDATYPWKPNVSYDALVNGVGYAVLSDAIEAVADGGTITLAKNVDITEDTRVNSGGSWYEGVYYVGDKSFTIDLNGCTITQNGAVNDYLFLFKNDGSKENVITFKNGTIDAGTTAYCALCTSTTSTQKITLNVEDLIIIGNNSNGAVCKIRGGSEFNVKAGTVITGKDNYTGIEAVGNNTVVNIYEGAEIYQNGTSSYVGAIVGASYNSTVNIYGGKGKSAKCGIIVMSTGATINVSGGEWIANGDGTVADDNHAVLVSQNNRNESGWACKSILNVTGGTFKGGYNCYGMGPGVEADDAQINISGGIFNAKPAKSYLEDGYSAVENEENGTWVIETSPATVGGVAYDTVAEAIAAAQEGQTVTVKAGEYTFPASSLKAGVTVECEEGTVFKGSSKFNVSGATIEGATFLNEEGSVLNSGQVNGTFKNCRFEGDNAFRYGYVGSTCVFEDCYFKENGSDWVFHFDGVGTGVTDAEIICRRCTFDGKRVAISGAIKNLVMEDCVFVNGDYINTYNTATFTNCSFGTKRVSPLGSHVTYKNCTMNGSTFTVDNITFFNGYPCKVTVGSEDFAFVSDSNALKNAVKNYDNITVILSHKNVYTGEYDFTGKANMTLRPYPDHSPKIEGLVWADNCNVTLKGLTLSNPNGVQHPNPSNSQYYNTINNQYPLVGAYNNSDIKFYDCVFDLVGPTVYGFYGYAHNDPVFEGCTFNCNKIRPIANNGDSITVNGCTFNDQYHYSVRIFENAGERQEVVYTNNTVQGTNDKGEFEGVNISKKGNTATIFADFTINGNTEGLKYRHHKNVTMDPSCTYDVTGFAFEKED